MRNIFFFCTLLLFFSCNEENTDDTRENSTPAATVTEEVQTQAATVPENGTPQVLDAVSEAETAQDDSEEQESETKSVTVKAEDKAAEPETADTKKTEKQTEPKKEKKRAVITFKEKKWNFGDIKDGDVVNHDFTFKNTGNAPLEIKNVTASCGCTQPSFPFLPIAPGEEGVIGVTFNSTGKINEQRPTVTVTTNGKPSVVKLNLEGMVRPK